MLFLLARCHTSLPLPSRSCPPVPMPCQSPSTTPRFPSSLSLFLLPLPPFLSTPPHLYLSSALFIPVTHYFLVVPVSSRVKTLAGRLRHFQDRGLSTSSSGYLRLRSSTRHSIVATPSAPLADAHDPTCACSLPHDDKERRSREQQRRPSHCDTRFFFLPYPTSPHVRLRERVVPPDKQLPRQTDRLGPPHRRLRLRLCVPPSLGAPTLNDTDAVRLRINFFNPLSNPALLAVAQGYQSPLKRSPAGDTTRSEVAFTLLLSVEIWHIIPHGQQGILPRACMCQRSPASCCPSNLLRSRGRAYPAASLSLRPRSLVTSARPSPHHHQSNASG